MLERSVREFLSNSDEAVVILDPDWTFVFQNDQAGRELGGMELIGRTLWEAFPEAAGTIFEQMYRRVLETGQTQYFTAFFAPLRAWFRIRAMPMDGHLAVFFRDLTARGQAEQWIERRRRTLDALFSKVPFGILQIDAGGEIGFVNEHFLDLVAPLDHHLNGRRFADFVHPEDRANFEARFGALLRDGGHLALECRLVRQDGGNCWCAISASVLGGADEATSAVIVVQDVTEARQSKARAAETTALLQTIMDSAEDLIFVKDLKGRFVLVNRALASSTPSLLGRTVDDQYEPGLAAGYNSADMRVIESSRPTIVEEIIPVGGECRRFQTIKVPWIVGGEMRGVIGISRDMTERLAVEERIQASEERYRLAARATNDTIWDWDLATDEITWNEAIEKLAGEKPGQTIDWWKERIYPGDRVRVLSSIEQFTRGEAEDWQCEYGFRHADGSYRAVFDRAFLVRSHDGTPVRIIGAMSDLSERMQAQKRLVQLQSELIHVSRVSAMGTMASALAHEINQPLTIIGNYMVGARRLLATEGEDARAAAAEAMELAAAEVTHAGEIIRRIRRMVAHGQIQSQPVPLRSLIEDALALALPNPTLSGIRVAIDRTGGTAQGDPVQLQQLLLNLIRNAIEAMEGSSERHLTISSRRHGSRVRVEVTDTGCGIPPERGETIFTAFGTTKPNGLGVGLTICRTIVEAHGGRIWVERTSDHGTCIAFELPGIAEG